MGSGALGGRRHPDSAGVTGNRIFATVGAVFHCLKAFARRQTTVAKVVFARYDFWFVCTQSMWQINPLAVQTFRTSICEILSTVVIIDIYGVCGYGRQAKTYTPSDP